MTSTPIRINKDMKKVIDDLLKDEHAALSDVTSKFTDKRCDVINKNIKTKNNFYALDKFGLLIRQGAYEKQNDPFGWKYDQDNNPIHVWTSIDVSEQQNVMNVLSRQKINKPTIFEPRGILYKVYINHFPERLKITVEGNK